MKTHDVLARAATAPARREGEPGAEARLSLGDLAHDEAFPDSGATGTVEVPLGARELMSLRVR